MKTTEFDSRITAAKLNESMFKKFGVKVNFDKYTREELENYRNLLRTNISQYEAKTNFNDLLTDESYQKNKHLADLLNLKIKEMLGEGAKVDRQAKHITKSMMKSHPGMGKDDAESAAWAHIKHPKKKKKAEEGIEETNMNKTTKAKKDYDGDGKVETPKDEVWGSRAKAAAKSGKPFKESFPTVADAKARAEKEKTTGKFDKKKNPESGGTIYTRKSSTFTNGTEDKPKEKNVKEAAKPDFLDLDKDGNKKEPMKGAAKSKKKMKESSIVFRRHVSIVNESLLQLIQEDEEGKAKAITAASDMVNDFTTWMQRVGQYQTKSMIELADAIRSEFGPQEAETFKQSVAPALAATIETLTAQREALSHAVAVLAGEAADFAPMGADTGIDGMDAEPIPSPEDEMNMAGDDGLGAEVGAGAPNSASREMRESRQHKLQEAHNIMRSLSR
jgi:hypothetical protein